MPTNTASVATPPPSPAARPVGPRLDRTLSLRRERRLVAALRRRDPDAVRRLQSQFGHAVQGYLAGALGDPAAAEDVLQQVLLEAWQRGPSYDPSRASPLTWLMTIARSRAVDALRKRVPTPIDPLEVTAALDRPDQAGGDDELNQLLERWRLAHLLTRLPAEEREVLRLRFYRDFSQREIAEATGMPLGTVKMRMVRGLDRLADLLAAEERLP